MERKIQWRRETTESFDVTERIGFALLYAIQTLVYGSSDSIALPFLGLD